MLNVLSNRTIRFISYNLQKYPEEINHLFLWGSSGTGKTLLLIECLRIMMAKCKLQKPKKNVEAIVLVYHHSIDEDSELMKDLEKKYLPSINSKDNIKPKTFKQLCKGNYVKLNLKII